MKSPTDPESLVDTDAVDVREVRRSFDDETFEALERRYETIEGVVLVGLTTHDGRVLLSTHEETDGWSPPGSDVDLGEDWFAAARRVLEERTGVAVEIDEPVLLERTIFARADGEGQRERESASADAFSADVLHVRASLAEDEPAFVDDPRVAEEFEHPAAGDDGLVLEWFDEVPADAHPNHEDHIELFLE